eukprot:TRINITY_DN1685_c0_g1_i1.p1 TRINITY_DN1685_c0_g1~~TRINITY_DN1685_c0_g1_i1.p1  ORF type:complete len:177 (-),score=19.18 TRINITY_DN1685_c0_g1_i1:25-555(-)
MAKVPDFNNKLYFRYNEENILEYDTVNNLNLNLKSIIFHFNFLHKFVIDKFFIDNEEIDKNIKLKEIHDGKVIDITILDLQLNEIPVIFNKHDLQIFVFEVEQGSTIELLHEQIFKHPIVGYFKYDKYFRLNYNHLTLSKERTLQYYNLQPRPSFDKIYVENEHFLLYCPIIYDLE